MEKKLKDRHTDRQTEIKLTFQITMDDAIAMKECQTKYDLPGIVSDDHWMEGSKVV